jgi:hemerythrin-like metal-binding protein
MQSISIGQMLIDNELLTNDQLSEAIKRQETDKRMIGEILIELGYISKQKLIDCLNIQVKEYNNMIYNLIKNDIRQDSNSLIDYDYYEKNKNELIFQTKKGWERIKLSTKITVIDIQHIWLIMLSHYASMLFKTFNRETKIKEISSILDLLISYSYEHFTVEEALLDIMKIEQNHYEQHKEFLKYFKLKIESIKKYLIENNLDVNNMLNDICDYLRNWILSHIAIHDTSYAVKITQSKNKEEIIEKWIKKLKDNNMTIITIKQKELYDSVTKN